MARRVGHQGQLIIDELRDLKRGDTVYITYWGRKYEPTIVTRVKTVECATIITVRKCKDLEVVRFVGYYTGKIAMNSKDTVLTLEKYWGDKIKRSLESADKKSQTIIERAEALKALRTLKDWLFDREPDITDEVE